MTGTDTDPTGRSRRPLAVGAAIAVVCLLLTAASTWAAARVDRKTEHRLLQVQTNQAATVLSTAIQLIQVPLSTALSVQKVAGPTGDPSAFTNLMSASVGPGKTFESASLWQRRGERLVRVASVGAEPAMAPGEARTTSYLLDAFESRTYTVRVVDAGSRSGIGYALADPGTDLVVYAERPIPADRRAPVDRDSAFASLHYAIYLGRKADPDALSTTDVAPASLPLTGNTTRAEVPFGDTVLTLVTSPRHHLGASLSRRLPLILLVGGLLLTIAASRAGQQLTRRRETVEALYGQQRDLSERLQRALLPQVHPAIPNLEIAAEYVAGAQGVDIGGDWYSIIGLEDGRYGFFVGDVSGRGIDAVAVMARARFTIRAYLLDGDSPAETLVKCSHQFDISVDGHMTTALVGIGDWRTGEVTIANAGHPAPLLLKPDGVEFVTTSPGWPLGAGPTAYESTTFTMAAGTTLLCFTDGLVERRTEHIDTGMQRLATTASDATHASADALVHHTVRTLRNDDAPDDVAVLAMRWAGAR
jgi:serine phosphatase RsbU (regulator of sigma subunit)/type II secretory pathway pseudopilin PulG